MDIYQDECFPAERRHLLDRLVQQQLGRVELQVPPHHVAVLALLLPGLQTGRPDEFVILKIAQNVAKPIFVTVNA
jgi:hypothetical protein